ncbi:hypothetical protein FRC04_007760 [Tulasnella sp. 424]|nr:hypothetical protein FRC04_007760 [Tulasnella sp. 424]KAG8975235.1 hypothetical protein FRC05_006178 [Tulasnella sp. 425]
MSSNPSEQYRMQLNTIAQAKYATFEVKTYQTAPANNPTWVATITVTGIAPGLSRSIYVGTVCQGVGPSKSLATDAASEQMLRVFAACGVVPTMRR